MAQTMFGDVFSARQTEMEGLERSAATLANLQPGRGSVYAAGMAGGMLGKGLGKAFGGVTPLEAKQQALQGVMDQFPNLDPTDPEQLGQVSSALRQAGLYEQADQVDKQSREAYSNITSRITAEKPTAAQAKTERGQRLAKACESAGEGSKACELYNLHIADMQAETESTLATAHWRRNLGELRGQEVAQDITGARIGGMQAETNYKIQQMKNMKTEDIFNNLTMDDRAAQITYKNRQMEALTRQALADAGLTEQQIQSGYGKAQADQLRQNIANKQLEAEKMTIENLIAAATQGDQIAQAELETQRKMAENANIQQKTLREIQQREYTQMEIDAGKPQADAEAVRQQIEESKMNMRKINSQTLLNQAELGNYSAQKELERRETESIIRKNDAAAKLNIKKAEGAGKPDLATLLTEQNRLNKEYITDIGDWRSRKADLQTVLQLVKNPSAISDIAMMTKYLKILDPASVARESEVALVESARGYLQTIAMLPEKAQEGRLLADGQIDNIIKAVETIYRSQHLSAYEAQESIRQKVATRNKLYGLNLDVRAIIPDHEIVKAEEIPSFGMTPPAANSKRYTIKKAN